jgi:hypothetical protein
MGKENTRTLNNTSYNGKKTSKKSYKKSSKKNRSRDISTTTEEMLEILNSDTEVTYQPRNNQFQNKLVPYNGEVPEQFMNMNMNMNQQTQVPMNHMGMGAISPANYDPLMLQQIAPLQTTQNFQNHGMPSNLMTLNNMFSNLSALGRGPNIGGMMGNDLGTPFPGALNNTIPNPQVPSMPQTPSMPVMPAPNTVGLGNLNMLGGARIL